MPSQHHETLALGTGESLVNGSSRCTQISYLLKVTHVEAPISRGMAETHLCWTVDVVLTPSSSSLLIFCSSSLLSSKDFSLSSVNVQINRFTWKNTNTFLES